MSTPRKTGILIAFISLLIGCGAFFYLSYGTGKTQAATAPAEARQHLKVITVHPESAAKTAPFIYNVRVEPAEQAMLFARADGFVEERLADIGDNVKAGQLLGRLSSPELEDGIRQMRAEIRRQQAVALLARKMLTRAEALKDSGAISKAEYDERYAEYNVATATRDTLKAKLEQLENEYAYTRIVAPFDGRITVRNIDRGDRISKNDTRPLFRIVRDDTLRIIADIPQTQIYAIDTTGKAKLTLPEMPEKTWELSFDRSSQEIDAAVGTMRMDFLLDNREHRLPSGIAGEIRIMPQEGSTVLTIPDNTIRLHNGKTAVMLLDDENRVAIRYVTTGRYTSTAVEIHFGLAATDRVILNPNALLKPGDIVETTEAGSETKPAEKKE